MQISFSMYHYKSTLISGYLTFETKDDSTATFMVINSVTQFEDYYH